MFERFFDFFIETMRAFFIPMVCIYHMLSSNPFFNIAIQDAPLLEKTANLFLVPLQYLCDGKTAFQTDDGEWKFVQRFDYSKAYWSKTAGCVIALPASLALGSFLKALSFCSKKTQQNHVALVAALAKTETEPHGAAYAAIGIDLGQAELTQRIGCQGYPRRPGDELSFKPMNRCLAEIASLFNEAKIPWWVDCGTCLGTLRHGGVIPWDNDIDIAVLITDFENARRALNKIDRTRYLVQDWSSRDIPNSFFKIYIRETSQLIDIYFYELDEEAQELRYIFSLDTNVFFPDWWKERERRFTVPVSFHTVFPLKKGTFDGIEVFVPNDPIRFLQRYYGENLNPARIFDPKTGRYEKDLSHPYWQMSHVH